MGIYAVKPAFRAALRPAADALVRAGVSAAAVTVAGVAFAVLTGVGVWAGREGGVWLLLVPAGAFLRTAANALDGMIAQASATAGPAGEVLNEAADRVGDVAVFLPVALVPGVPALLVAGALAAMLVASFIGVAVKAAGGPRVYGGVMGKPDRMLVLGVAGVLALWLPPGDVLISAMWVVLVGCLVTIVQRAVAARHALRSAR